VLWITEAVRGSPRVVAGGVLIPAGEDLYLRVGTKGPNRLVCVEFAILDGRWKLVLCPGSGGWSEDDAQAAAAGKPLVQLYDMAADPGETRNLCRERPDRVQAMVDQLKAIVARGRSTPGRPQMNDVEVDIWRLDSMPGVVQADLPCDA
jgi:hypothetical protein